MTNSQVVALAEDPLVCPQLAGYDPYRTPGWSFAREWAAHIHSTIDLSQGAAEDPRQMLIY